MPYGLQVRNSSGTIVYDSSSVTWLQVEQFIVEADATVTKVYSGISDFRVIVQLQMIDAAAGDRESYVPLFAVNTVFLAGPNDTQVKVYPKSGQTSERVIVTVLAQG